MSKPKVTPWFSAYVKPIHVGEYEYRYTRHKKLTRRIFRVLWDGSRFIIKDQKMNGFPVWVERKDKWRGLAEKP